MFQRLSKREPQAVPVSAPERDILKVRYQLVRTADRFAKTINITINPIRKLFSIRADSIPRNENLVAQLHEVIAQLKLDPKDVEMGVGLGGPGLSVVINIAITADEVQELLHTEKDDEGGLKLDPLMHPQLLLRNSHMFINGVQTTETLSGILGDSRTQGNYRFYLTNNPSATSCIIERATGMVFDADYLTLTSPKLELEDVKVVAVVEEIGTTSEAKLALCQALECWITTYFTETADRKKVSVEEVELVSNSNYYHAASAVEYLHQHWRFGDYIAVTPITNFYPRPIIMHYKGLQQKTVYRVLEAVCVELEGERIYKQFGVESFAGQDLWISTKKTSALVVEDMFPPIKRVYWKPGRKLATGVYELGTAKLITPTHWSVPAKDEEDVDIKPSYSCWAGDLELDGNAIIGTTQQHRTNASAKAALLDFTHTLSALTNKRRKKQSPGEVAEAYNEASVVLGKRIKLAELEQKALETEEQLEEVSQQLVASSKDQES